MTSLAAARHQWDEGKRRLAGEGEDTARSRHLDLLVGAVIDELRRRLGQTFTLGELAGAYDGADDWVREVIVTAMPPRSRASVGDAAVIQDAAFARYAQGAVDYSP
jgi:hypothetical protein